MNYFIGYFMKGEVAEWHKSLTKHIYEKFNTWKIYEKLPPHVTIFYPFTTDTLQPIKELLQEWAQRNPGLGNLGIRDFGRFDDKVVFAKIEASSIAHQAIANLRALLLQIPEMPKPEFPTWNPHATMMNRVTPEDIQNIWDYIQTLPKPNFSIPFDNVTIFRYEGERKWITDTSFKIA